MIKRNLPYALLVLVLLAAGIGQILHRHWVFDVPLLPGESQSIWSVEAKLEFTAHGEPVRVRLATPDSQPGFMVLRDSGASPGYGLNFIQGEHSAAEWTKRSAEGRQVLFYRVDLLESDAHDLMTEKAPPIMQASWPEPYASAVAQVVKEAYSTSADHFSLTRELLKAFEAEPKAQHVQLLVSQYHDKLPGLLVNMLNMAGVPARVVYGLRLQDGRRQQLLEPYIRVWQGQSSQVFDVPLQQRNPALFDPDAPLLLWEQRGDPVIDVTGADNSQLRFSMIRKEESAFASVANRLSDQHELLNFSIHSLPVEEQAMFKTILLIPIGALVVCLLRVLVGIKTSGTFMPVLIALAFIQTSLITGLVGFLVVVATGLVIRSYLSRLNLLLVARISAVIITVIAIIGLFSVAAYKFGLTEGLKITFFPMIILSWTIERMSILWEEEGPREVVKQGGGSLLTAVLAFWAMNNPLIQHLTFNFIGVQLVVLALVLILGTYTGYRLLELRRFVDMETR
ncbi:inactive transglutaminase family protein [Oceanobacter mangrovi]|uniref:inactive transglutaminase family protein n=1 Tax=Oceanobacter mangrovi TaxID=2862510 RepID=UPI001C8D4E6A|nr:inactive transglutaminase family protein [Oceanobacter mangrovi]